MSPLLSRSAPVSAPTPRGFRRVWIDETVEVAADEASVYALLRDIDAWPTWVPGLRRVGRSATGAYVPGRSRFSMMLRMAPIPLIWVPCKLHVMHPGRIEWGGGGFGSVIHHRLEISSISPGVTAVRHVEYATNLLAVVLVPFERIFARHDQRWSEEIRRHFS